MATVRPGIFAAPQADTLHAERGRITQVALADAWRPSVRVDAIEHAGATDVITDADVLVVAGRGIGSKKNLAVAQRLADALGGKLGCTRPLVESGWLEYWHQVGQTGVSVSPKLLISLGVSGAIQHVAGTGGAQTVIAVNEDPNAPIFGSATYRVVGDCVEVVRELTARLQA